MASVPPQASTFHLRAPQNRTEYLVFVEAPDAAAEPGPWPAVLWLDGDDQFRFAVRAYRAARRAGTVPPLLLVGIGYGASYTRPGNRRNRDYTPTAMKGEPETGGADDFLEFLTGPLWHELAGRYPLNEDVRALAGHSLGALLVLHALFQRAPFFNRLLASAPALWFDERVVLHHAAKLRAKVKKLAARLFLAVGAGDSPSMLEDLRALERQLAAEPFRGLEITSRQFAGRGHHDAIIAAFREGLPALFAPGEEPPAPAGGRKPARRRAG
jgi:predicted alpha/beta superfamily hydrolase